MKYFNFEGLSIEKDGNFYYIYIYNIEVIGIEKYKSSNDFELNAVDFSCEKILSDFIKDNNTIDIAAINQFYDNVESYHFEILTEDKDWLTVDINIFKSLLKELVKIAIDPKLNLYDIVEEKFVDINRKDISNFKIFESIDRINFVDKNNVLVGYEYESQCCEIFGYFISEDYEDEVFDIENCIDNTITDKSIINAMKDRGFVFEDNNIYQNKGKFHKVTYKVFNLTNKKQLVIYNIHGGWYLHGFNLYENKIKLDSGKI